MLEVKNNELVIIGSRMSIQLAQAFKTMVESYVGRTDRDRIIHKLVVDDCSIRDNILAVILSAVQT
jgi:hypothetical protein